MQYTEIRYDTKFQLFRISGLGDMTNFIVRMMIRIRALTLIPTLVLVQNAFYGNDQFGHIS